MNSIDQLKGQIQDLKQMENENRRSELIKSLRNKHREAELVVDVLKSTLKEKVAEFNRSPELVGCSFSYGLDDGDR